MINHYTTRIPKDIKKELVVITGITVITGLGFDMMAFLLQLGKDNIAAGRTILGLTMIALYYMKGVIDTCIYTWTEEIQDTFRAHYETTINNRIVKILLKVRDKVWRYDEETNSKEVMTTNAILISCRKYIEMIWRLKTEFPKNVVKMISLVVMFVGFVMVTTVEIQNTFAFISILIIVSFLSFVFSNERDKIWGKNRNHRRRTYEKSEVAKNDVLNIEPITNAHANYLAQNYIALSNQILNYDKQDRKRLNIVNIFETLVDSAATVIIIIMKTREVGLSNVTLETVLSIISLITIYNQIISRTQNIIRMVEDYRKTFKDVYSYQEDFMRIICVLDEEEKFEDKSFGKVSEIRIPTFSVQYQVSDEINDCPFTLKSDREIRIKRGDVVLFIGPTGSGKSTLLKMITEKVRFGGFSLEYVKSKEGKINCLMHQTDGRLGSNTIYSELTLNSEAVDEEKLIFILKGLHLYEEVSEKSSDSVINFLKRAHIENFSAGQKQRFAIARLLYNLDDTIEIVAFDEATNALNDAITLKTLDFIKKYCGDKILLIATHQVDIGETVATKKLVFTPDCSFYKVEECTDS